MEPDAPDDLHVLTEMITALKKLGKEDQKRALQAVATFLNISLDPGRASSWSHPPAPSIHGNAPSKPTFSEERVVSPKDFMREKAPRTDAERATCLAYYLTHYRETPHFKTLDISTLNTEAAQPKFSNASIAVDSATKAGLLVPAVKGSKQITAAGELYVQHLPDRDAARSGIQGVRQRRRPRKAAKKNNSDSQ